MKNRGANCAVTVCALLIPTAGYAQQPDSRWNLSATIASDYYAYGLSQTDSSVSGRVAIDYQQPRGFFAGGFAANVDYANDAGRAQPRDLQLGYYAGYRSRGSSWSAHVALSGYRYPGSLYDYDYSVVTAGAAYRDRYFVAVSYSANWFGYGRSGEHAEIGTAQPLGWDLELGINAGHVDVDDDPAGAFTYWNVGISRVVDRFAVDLRYHASGAERRSWLGDPYDGRFVLSVSYAVAPRGR